MLRSVGLMARRMSGRMKRVSFGVCLLCVLAAMLSCEEKDHTPEQVLRGALESLNRGDVDAYLKRVDLGNPMDSAKESFMRDALRQHQGWRKAERPDVASVDILDEQMQCDTVCMVFYQYTYADSTCEVCSQKMVKVGDEWKIRVRN